MVDNDVYMSFPDLFELAEVWAEALKMTESWPDNKIQTQLEKGAYLMHALGKCLSNIEFQTELQMYKKMKANCLAL